MAEWQTRRTQNPLSERACGFKSHPGHSVLVDTALLDLLLLDTLLLDTLLIDTALVGARGCVHPVPRPGCA